jgi:ubiquinone biosynthesis accessory factor UbiJ
MATQSPFSLAAQALQQFGSSFKPPEWVVDESLNRVVLFLNHVLMQEPEAMRRLARQKGQRIQLEWHTFNLQLSPTPAGLLERVQVEGFDLRLTVTEESPLDIASALLRGDKPSVRIEGDVQLAAEVNWLIDHVRWDAEGDLARLIGDAPAHTLAQWAHSAMTALKNFTAPRRQRNDNGHPSQKAAS